MPKSFLSAIKDNRRKEGKRYKLGDILLFSIFAIPGGAVSYRKIHTFIKGHYDVPNEKFGLKRKRIPAYTTVRNTIIGLSVSDSEVRAVIKAERKRDISDTKKKQWKNTDETVYYISTFFLSAGE